MLNSDIFVLHVKRFMSAYLQLTYIRAPDCGVGKKYGQQIVTQTRLRLLKKYPKTVVMLCADVILLLR